MNTVPEKDWGRMAASPDATHDFVQPLHCDAGASGAQAQQRPLFSVLCVRFDGRERLYQAYRTRSEADAVATALARVGCPARVAAEAEG